MGKLELIPGVRATPEMVLRYALDNIEGIEEVIIVVLEKDGDKKADCIWSEMNFGVLTFMERVLSLEINDLIRRPTEDVNE